MKKLMSNSIVDKFKLKNEREEKEKKRCTFWYCVVNDEAPLTSSQIVEQVEVIHEVIYQECLSWMTQH